MAGLALAVTCLLVVAAPTLSTAGVIAVLTAAVIALTAGEMLQSAAAWDLTFALAPADRQGEYLAVFNVGTAVERIAGPFLVILLLGSGWPVCAGAAAVFTVAGLAGARLATRGGARESQLTGSPAHRADR
jgi:hypothetical protein